MYGPPLERQNMFHPDLTRWLLLFSLRRLQNLPLYLFPIDQFKTPMNWFQNAALWYPNLLFWGKGFWIFIKIIYGGWCFSYCNFKNIIANTMDSGPDLATKKNYSYNHSHSPVAVVMYGRLTFPIHEQVFGLEIQSLGSGIRVSKVASQQEVS